MEEDRVTRAYNAFMMRLFGHVPLTPGIHSTDRETYTKTMQEIQEEYGLKQGEPDFLEWILTMLGRSPQIYENEGAGKDGTEGTETVGEATPSQPN